MVKTKKTTNLTIYDIGGKLGSTGGHFGGIAATELMISKLGISSSNAVKILEIGCGTGGTSCLIAEQYGGEVTGIDISEDMIEGARKRAVKKGLKNVTFKVANAHKLPFENESFDIVIAESATALIPDPSKALSEYYRVTKPNGQVGNIDLFIIPGAPEKVFELINEVIIGAVGRAIKIPTADQYYKLFEEAGYTNLSIEKNQESVLEYTSFKYMKKEYGILGLTKITLKMCYYMIFNGAFRRLLFKIRKFQRVVFEKDENGKCRYVGYIVLVGQKPG
ncbi:MAG: class I SAM-dependent methyltransferase [Candidatus Heimdallarchaeota archaeon]|nr:class I SAM-dependent methyltransferase [Candidatus Heimdallarchaeota archaeon]